MGGLSYNVSDLCGSAKVRQHNGTRVTHGPTRGSRPKIHPDTFKAKTANKRKQSTTTEARLPPQISAPHWTTLGGQSNSMALETPGTFFFFFLKEVVPVSPENWGEGRT